MDPAHMCVCVGNTVLLGNAAEASSSNNEQIGMQDVNVTQQLFLFVGVCDNHLWFKGHLGVAHREDDRPGKTKD